MKFIVIPYIALGLILTLVIAIEYNCNGSEVLSNYYGSPFIFKKKSLGSSLTYYYSITGLLLNVILWSIFIFLIDKGIHHLRTRALNSTLFRNLYRSIIWILIAISSVCISWRIITLGSGFDKSLNYWYWDLDCG